MNHTKHCGIGFVIVDATTSYWTINLQPAGACLPDDFAFGLPLAWQFDTKEKAYDFALNSVDPLVDGMIGDIIDDYKSHMEQ